MELNLEEQIKCNLFKDATQIYLVCRKIAFGNLEVTSKIALSFMPFLSLYILDIIKKFGLKENSYFIEIINEYYPNDEEKFMNLLNQSRATLKQDTEDTKYSKNRNRILKNLKNNYKILTKDYNCLQKLVTRILGQKDFFVFSYKGIPYFNNIQSMKFIDLFIDNQYKIKSEELEVFSACATRILHVFISKYMNIEDFSYKHEDIIKNGTNEITTNDYFVYEERRSDFFKNNLDKELNIYLFDLLCQVNCSNFLYSSVFDLKGHPLLRIKVINYLIVIKGLWIYDKQFNNIPKSLKSIMYDSKKLFRNDDIRTSFRNNVFHFDLPNESVFEVNLINSLVKYYFGRSSDEFNCIVTDTLNTFVIEINKILFGEQKKVLRHKQLIKFQKDFKYISISNL